MSLYIQEDDNSKFNRDPSENSKQELSKSSSNFDKDDEDPFKLTIRSKNLSDLSNL